ncbi:GreA/GreB family elongation factor [Echinimonas agarilytica]|uniref:GreA/GreB family elongation factor n=1 Tax=Echinimonas agarilytica TaxID=1215918 RepID=A0AA41WCG2_9GAMM|nr:GreA/GreB family elongation factor [Echinimonas agarilytica]MCM2681389.1 GreA/GreB family elongation factor [Echinimonas agarilytica]
MNKTLLLEHILMVLTQRQKLAEAAAMRAYNTATDGDNVAENKYDTFALEASYLAHGQSQRVLEYKAQVAEYKALEGGMNNIPSKISMASLVELVGAEDVTHRFFVGPSAGGLKIEFERQHITIVTPQSPLGNALMGRQLDDGFQVDIAGKITDYEVVSVQ